ncbi:hypothetical protein LTR95_000938 [Oleoguttula sp. CCFEE 5521]
MHPMRNNVASLASRLPPTPTSAPPRNTVSSSACAAPPPHIERTGFKATATFTLPWTIRNTTNGRHNIVFIRSHVHDHMASAGSRAFGTTSAKAVRQILGGSVKDLVTQNGAKGKDVAAGFLAAVENVKKQLHKSTSDPDESRRNVSFTVHTVNGTRLGSVHVREDGTYEEKLTRAGEWQSSETEKGRSVAGEGAAEASTREGDRAKGE